EEEARLVGPRRVAEDDHKRRLPRGPPQEIRERVEQLEAAVSPGRELVRAHVRQELTHLRQELRDLRGAWTELRAQAVRLAVADIGAECLDPRPVGGRTAAVP